jgi:Zn ribbon nucleic-acid-binding protein
MKLVCPECKNDVDLSLYPSMAVGHIIECDKCGITLTVKAMKENGVETEIVDEGK